MDYGDKSLELNATCTWSFVFQQLIYLYEWDVKGVGQWRVLYENFVFHLWKFCLLHSIVECWIIWDVWCRTYEMRNFQYSQSRTHSQKYFKALNVSKFSNMVKKMFLKIKKQTQITIWYPEMNKKYQRKLKSVPFTYSVS